VVAALSYKYIEEPIRHGAVERQWARYKTAPAEIQRKLMARFSLAAAGIIVGLVIIVVGLGNGGSAAVPQGFGKQTEVVVKPSDTVVTTVPGETTTTPTAPPPGAPTTAPGTPVTTVTAIGDSVMLGAYVPLKSTIDTMFNAPVTGVDAAESRQFSAGVDLIQSYKDKGQLGQDVVVQLGTNGNINPDDFDRMMEILEGRKVILLNSRVPRPWEDQVNQTIADGANRYKATLIDWHTIANEHPEFFWDDGIHLRPEGAAFYAQLIALHVTP
jgi:lysophospholipase L1-like esterase